MVTATHAPGSRKVRRQHTEGKAEHVQYVSPDRIIGAPSDNPRFWTEGFEKTDDKVAKERAETYFASAEFTAFCKSLDATRGPVTPLIVEDNNDGTYNLLDGFGRHEWGKRRAKRHPSMKLPVIVRKVAPQNKVTLKVALNTARREYDPLAQGAALRRVILERGTVVAASRDTGIPRATIVSRVNLIYLPTEIKRMLSAKVILLTTATSLTEYDGFHAYVKSQNNEPLTPEEKNKAAHYSAAIRFIAKGIDRRVRESENGGKAVTAGVVRSLYNQFIGKALNAKKKTGKKAAEEVRNATVDSIIQVEPSGDSVERFLSYFGRMIAEELCGDRDLAIINSYTDKMVAMATPKGWACDIDLLEENLDEDGQPVYTYEVAAALNKDLVASYVAQGFMEYERRYLPSGHALESHEAWQAFIRSAKDLPNMIQKIREVTVVASRIENPT